MKIRVQKYLSESGVSSRREGEKLILCGRVKVNGIAEALKHLSPDILLLQEVQGQHLKRTVQFNDFPDQSQHEFFGEFLTLNSSYGKNAIHPVIVKEEIFDLFRNF